ncbi:protein kinase domain-containing protein [Lyngbya aestuarii]|uniref:protein kinase domain-containing protein n=1 Tax=Lyngbya aestuarii TaxID=118322 RepID=UPI00403DD72B
MSYCLNPRCPKPQNPSDAKFCSTCGCRLLLGDRYRALRLISQEGMGRTFLGIDEQDTSPRQCIIKQLSRKNQGAKNIKQAAELFRQEALRLQALGQHPQIPQLLAYFEPDKSAATGMIPALVQTFIPGESLAEELIDDGSFNESEIRQLLTEMLPVLQFVHSHQVIHRDINPQNIIRRYSDGKLVLVDFGAAKFTTKTALAKAGTVIGSAAYTAPEQLRGKAVASSDLYSLGVTCIHLLTSVHPFDLFNSLEGTWIWQDYLTEPVSEQLSQILNKMLLFALKRRYHSAAQILEDLTEGNLASRPKTFVQPSSLSSTIQPDNLTPTWQCIRTLTGHASSIHAVALSTDEKFLASGSADKTIKIWHLDSGIIDYTLFGHLNLVDAVAFSPDGYLLASGSWDHRIKIWNLETGDLIHTLCEHSGWIKSLVISQDGQTLASGSSDKSIKIWHCESGQLKATLEGHTSAIDALAFSLDGKMLASGSGDKTIKLWDVLSGKVRLILRGHSQTVNCLSFSPSGQILFSGSLDKTIKIWNLNSGELLNTFSGHTKAVNDLDLDAQGNTLISGSADQTIKIWHPGSGKLLHTLSGHTAGVTALAISANGRIIGSGSQDKTLKIWQFQ